MSSALGIGTGPLHDTAIASMGPVDMPTPKVSPPRASNGQVQPLPKETVRPTLPELLQPPDAHPIPEHLAKHVIPALLVVKGEKGDIYYYLHQPPGAKYAIPIEHGKLQKSYELKGVFPLKEKRSMHFSKKIPPIEREYPLAIVDNPDTKVPHDCTTLKPQNTKHFSGVRIILYTDISSAVRDAYGRTLGSYEPKEKQQLDD